MIRTANPRHDWCLFRKFTCRDEGSASSEVDSFQEERDKNIPIVIDV